LYHLELFVTMVKMSIAVMTVHICII